MSETIKEGSKVKIFKLKGYRMKECKKFYNKVGTVTNVDEGYQAPIMYSVMFSLHPFVQESFFGDEVKLVIKK